MAPKLYIISSAANKCWLGYISAEFARINKAKFDIVISESLPIEEPENKNILYHLESCSLENSIPDRSFVDSCRDVKWLSSQLYIFPETWVAEWPGACKYDLLWNAFVFLSRLEEYHEALKGYSIGSYCINHPRNDKSTFSIPVVNILFNELELLIRGRFPQLGFGGSEPPYVEYSHDVDYITKTAQLRIKQTLLNLYKTGKSVFRRSHFLPELKKTCNFLFSSPSYWCFDYWENLEKRFKVRSVFYIYAGTGRKNLKTWILDPSYHLNNRRLVQKMKQLVRDGFEIGLHGSYESALDEVKLMSEKAWLEKRAGIKVTKIRQHWLRYNDCVTPKLHDKHFLYDSTLGWNDLPGFRSGCASRYRPYDHGNEKPFDHMETPQVIMDSNIFEYGSGDVEKSLEKALEMLGQVNYVKSAAISVSWHQRVCSRDYNWQAAYEKIIKKMSGIKFAGKYL